MILFKSRNLDELQLRKRGDIFKHGLFSLMGLLLVNALLYSWGIEWASGKWAELTIILFTVVLCSIEFICYDIYPMLEKRQKLAIYFLGVYGVVSILAGIYDFQTLNTKIIVDGKIVSSALAIVYGIMFITVFLVYIIKSRYNKRHENDE